MSKKRENDAGEIQRLDALIAKEKQTIAALQSKLDQTLDEARIAEETQREVSYAALAEGEVEAERNLTEAEDTLSRFQARTRSIEVALQRAREKLKELEAQRAEAFREAKRQELQAEMEKLIQVEAKVAEEALTDLVAVRNQMAERVRKLNSLAMLAGMQPRYDRVLKNFWRCVEHKLNISPIWLTPDARQVFSKSIPEVLKRTLGEEEINEETPPAEERAAG